jgi:phenylacetate-CoA ligase
MGIPGVGRYFNNTATTENHLDCMKVSVELEPGSFTGDLRALESLRRRIAAELRDEILVTPEVDLVEHDSLAKAEGKAVRVRDLRTT